MKLFDYQLAVYDEAMAIMTATGCACIAATTGFGKTELAAHFIKQHPKARVLILAHGQTLLSENFQDRLEDRGIRPYRLVGGAVAGVRSANKCRVVVSLPQTIGRVLDTLKAFDYLIVDEAHQFYGDGKGLYSKILKWHNGAPELLLTASHYGLNVGKAFFSREMGLHHGRIDDPRIELPEVDLNLTDDDYTESKDLKPSVRALTPIESITAWLTPDRLPAIVQAHNIKSAERIYKALSKTFSTTLSHSQNDSASKNIAALKKGKFDVCVVVNRASLGFDFDKLRTFIDASYSQNPIRVEQAFGRVSRRHPEKVEKLFIKLTPHDWVSNVRVVMTAVLALGVTEIYREWNGQYTSLPIKVLLDEPMTSAASESSGETTTTAEASPANNPDTLSVRGDDDAGEIEPQSDGQTYVQETPVMQQASDSQDKLPVRKFFPKLVESFGEYLGLFEDERVGRIMMLSQALHYCKAIRNGTQIRDAEGNQKRLLELARSGADKPSQNTKEGRQHNSYMSPSSSCYDAVFVTNILAVAPSWAIVPAGTAADATKLVLLDMARSGADRPHYSTPLGWKLKSYTTPSSSCYDSEFGTEIRAVAPGWFVSKSAGADATKLTLLEMARAGADKPHKKTPLGTALRRYTSKSQGSYDAELSAEIRKLRPDWFKPVA